MRRRTHEWVWVFSEATKNMCDITRLYMRDEWVLWLIWMSRVTHINESCHTYEWVMSHIWTSHVTHMSESCDSYQWVMSQIWEENFTHMNESWHTYQWVTSHIWMENVTHMNLSWHTHGWVLSHIRMSHVAHVNESGVFRQRYCCYCACRKIIHMCDMTHSYVWHDSFICVTWLIHMCDMTRSYVWYDSSICVADINKSYEVLRLCWGCACCSSENHSHGEVGDWGRDPKKCTGRDWGMGSSTI